MTIHLYDGMAVLRRKFEHDLFGQGVRGVVNEMLSAQRTDVHLWCFEGRYSLSARRKIFDGYKRRDSTMRDGMMPLIELVREAMKHTRAIQIQVDNREADDVLAHLCHVYGPTAVGGVRVHTVDRDLLVLQTPNVSFPGLKPLKIVMDNSDHSKDVEVPPAQIPLYKALCGDPSDKIPGMPGFGPKTFAVTNRVRLQLAFDALCRGDLRPELWVEAGVKQRTAERICAPEQAELLRCYRKLIDFLPMPGDWEDGITPGVPNPDKVNEVLTKFKH